MSERLSQNPSFLAYLDEVCDRFEAAWQTGQRPQLEQYLADALEPLRGEVCGEIPTREEYYGRFPKDISLIDAGFQDEGPTKEHLSTSLCGS